jgi:hypothetical protein
MGLTSGRGSHGGARRRRAGSAGHDSAGQGEGGYGRTSLVSGDQQDTVYRSTPVGGGQRGDTSDGYRYNGGDFDTRAYDADTRATAAAPSGPGPPGPAGRAGGWDGRQPGPAGEQGTAAAFLEDQPPAGRRVRAGRRRGRGGWLSRYPAPVVSVVAIVVCAALVAAGLGVNHLLTARSVADAAVNPNCTLIVPANPLTAQGLATPYQLTATDPAAGPCNEANNNQTAFVQGAVLNPKTGQISIYNPLVVDAGTQPAVAPVVPKLPAGAVVAVWFGYNGTTLTLAGADQNLTAGTGTTGTGVTATPTSAATQGATAQATPTTAPSSSGSATATATAGSATPTGSATSAGAATPTGTASPTQSATTVPSVTATPAAPASAGNTAPTGTRGTGAPPTGGASVQSVGSALLQPGYPDPDHHHHHHPSPSASAASSASGTPTGSAPATGGTVTGPPNFGDSPAASGTPDAILQQANCVAGEDINGQFSSFTQVGACNATAFFKAANQAIAAGKLRVPAPGFGRDGQVCLTTRSFGVIDQDQSDNVTTEYLATGDGQIAQDTAANKNSLGGATVIFNGSDNGLIDLFVDPALGCRPWEVPNLADGGAPAPGLPLDELQAAAWAGRQGGGPAALVPLNDPMTVDANGNFSTDKTNTYRSLVDMPALPAGQSPATYCSAMERIQGTRLQQDVNLLIKGPSPAPAAASNLFTFLGMRLQQSFTNLNCGNFGMNNDVSTTADGNGVVVAACFVHQVRPVTRGRGNPTAGQTMCPATTNGQQGQGNNGNNNGQGNHGHGGYNGEGGYSGQPDEHGMSRQGAWSYWHHHHHG